VPEYNMTVHQVRETWWGVRNWARLGVAHTWVVVSSSAAHDAVYAVLATWC
jgi:hypothetical protein